MWPLLHNQQRSDNIRSVAARCKQIVDLKVAFGVWLLRSLSVIAFTAVGVVGFASSAQARLVYERGFRTPHPAIWIAHNDGTSAKRLAYGISPLISPNGRLVVYLSTPPTGKARLMMIAATGGKPRALLSASLLFAVSWSPDSKRIAVAEQPPATRTRQRTQQIATIDVATGGIHAVSRASLPYAMSFSPNGDQLAYTWSVSANPLSDNIYRAPATGGRAVRLTHDGHSMSPLWGRNWIVFVRESPGTQADPIPKLNLYLIRPNGTGLRRLTHAPIGKPMFGFTPIAWSANGRRLIAEFAGPGISYVVTVDPRTGAVCRVGQHPAGGVIRGAALSREGTTILGVQEGARGVENLVTLPYRGGKAHVLARNAVGPSWSR
jgi:Lipoprotein LpqB beta-propeller domain